METLPRENQNTQDFSGNHDLSPLQMTPILTIIEHIWGFRV